MSRGLLGAGLAIAGLLTILSPAAAQPSTGRAVTVKSSKSNTSDRMRSAPKAKAKGTIVKSKSNITNN
jgi:hypothetical protein